MCRFPFFSLPLNTPFFPHTHTHLYCLVVKVNIEFLFFVTGAVGCCAASENHLHLSLALIGFRLLSQQGATHGPLTLPSCISTPQKAPTQRMAPCCCFGITERADINGKLASVVTPVVEITQIVDPLPFFISVPRCRVRDMKTYREPQVRNHGSEGKYPCTHTKLPSAYYTSNRYDLSAVVDQPMEDSEINCQLALRYQLNPLRIQQLQPKRKHSPVVFESVFLRGVFLETVRLDVGSIAGGSPCEDTLHQMCGVNVLTHAEGIFSAPGNYASVGEWTGSHRRELVTIYSTLPTVRKELQRNFRTGSDGPSLIVDDVFMSWCSLGWVSLNELHDMGAIYTSHIGGPVAVVA
ncbi:hypothetical protein TRVL_05608 [Trypanosoma vivax]|nr:hypothetical protein TRVL_05608 [Trypanosoma vivax]